FSADRCWFLAATREAGKAVHQCAVIRRDGTLEASARAEQGDAGWLGALPAGCAANHFLLAPTDEGMVRVEPENGALIETRRFPDTEPFVDSRSRLFAGRDGVYVVNQREIVLLQLK